MYAGDGATAVEKAIRYLPDLIIMDWEMPKMNGIEAVAYLKSRSDTAHIPIIMTTAFTSSEHLEKALKTGATDYVKKPIDEVELLARVNSALQIVTSYKQILKQKEEIEEKTKKLEHAFAEIERKNDNIMSSIKYAKRIQDAMLPNVAHIQKFIPELFVLYRPRDVVSGDFYWFASLAPKDENTPEKFVLAISDCTGHGVPGAFMSMLGDTLLNQIVNIFDMDSPDEILEKLHFSIRKALKQDETENRDGMDIGVCVITPEQKKIDFAGARVPLVCITNNELTAVKGDHFSVGGLEKGNLRSFTKHEVDITPQTVFYMYTDGYQDQFSTTSNSKFMAKRFRKLLQKVHKYPFEEQKKILNHILEDWMRDTKQIDDILVVGFKFL
jgi:CheY-like chemotaxis protein